MAFVQSEDPAPYGKTGVSNEDQAVRSITKGERLVGIGFNPSGDNRVQLAKQNMADVADLLYDQLEAGVSDEKKFLIDHALGEILSAQMAAVKVLTYKD